MRNRPADYDRKKPLDIIFRAAFRVSASFLLAGCAVSPLMDYNLEVPAQSLRTIDADPVMDGRARFRGIFCTLLQTKDEGSAGAKQCGELLHYLNDESPEQTASFPLPAHDPDLRIVIVPGLLNECVSNLVNVFEISSDPLRRKGYRVDTVNVGGRWGSGRNARQIADYLRRSPLRDGERLLLIGHSKGTVDILRFLVDFPEMAEGVTAVASVAGAVNGSPLADWPAARLKFWSSLVPEGWCDPGDEGAVDSLRRSARLEWLSENALPESVQYFSLVAFTQREQVAWPLVSGYDLLSYIDPRNDGQLLFFDQVIPGATLLGYANADHWSVALPVTSNIHR